MGEIVIGEDGEEYEKVTRTIDYLSGEVKYVRRPHASPLRYRVQSARLTRRDEEGKRLDGLIRRNVLDRNDDTSIDLYVWGEYQTEDGGSGEGLLRVVQDEQFKVVAIELVGT